MDLKSFLDVPPWEWPRDTAKKFQKALTDRLTDESDRLIAAELAGDMVVINDRLAEALMAIVDSPDETDEMRAKAAISLGPVLEQADTFEFDDPDDVPIKERTFLKIQALLHKVCIDTSVAKEVRRRILEASVRAPEEWHREAISTAYSSGDKEWMLTAVFAMRYVRGFDNEILDALESADPEIHYEAVEAAGNWGLVAAGPHVVALVQDRATEKPLLIAAISAVGAIFPQQAREILEDLAESDDEEISEAAEEAIMMAEGGADEEEFDEEEEDEGEWIN